ncbi:N-acetylmuramoyl-L-alanine amidase [Streptomyces sp. NPDC057217]|uniref:peptidoglycan recognition protein family protein n=1 Tax=Streptomyces sp. NPDC057217 TaxID=3346054 RepID=UPI0036439FB6
MSAPMSAARFLQALRDEGLTVVTTPGWETHNRNHKGPWGPVHGVMIHHTVTGPKVDGVAICRHGYQALPGPLCHGVIRRDGTIHLVGYGRTNHAGSGDPDVLQAVIAEKSLPTDNEATKDGNRHFYGFECENLGDGVDPWPAAQLDAIEKAAAAVCRVHGWDQRSVIGHLEWQPGKSDPKGFTMASMRARIDARLDGKPDPDPKPAPKPKPTPKPTAPKPTPKPYTPPTFPAGLAPGRAKPSARALQRVLKATGFMPKATPEADNYGPITEASVNRFHAAHPQYRAAGKTYDPAIGPRGWAYLHRLAYNR